ncbi:hypothetical protein KIPB_014503, partial [Kipferlia bialata]
DATVRYDADSATDTVLDLTAAVSVEVWEGAPPLGVLAYGDSPYPAECPYPSTALSSNTLVVGCPSLANPSLSGCVHLYSRATATAPWRLVHTLSPDGTGENRLSLFGSQVGLSTPEGGWVTLVVAAPVLTHTAGSVCIYDIDMDTDLQSGLSLSLSAIVPCPLTPVHLGVEAQESMQTYLTPLPVEVTSSLIIFPDHFGEVHVLHQSPDGEWGLPTTLHTSYVPEDSGRDRDPEGHASGTGGAAQPEQ